MDPQDPRSSEAMFCFAGATTSVADDALSTWYALASWSGVAGKSTCTLGIMDGSTSFSGEFDAQAVTHHSFPKKDVARHLATAFSEDNVGYEFVLEIEALELHVKLKAASGMKVLLLVVPLCVMTATAGHDALMRRFVRNYRYFQKASRGIADDIRRLEEETSRMIKKAGAVDKMFSRRFNAEKAQFVDVINRKKGEIRALTHPHESSLARRRCMLKRSGSLTRSQRRHHELALLAEADDNRVGTHVSSIDDNGDGGGDGDDGDDADGRSASSGLFGSADVDADADIDDLSPLPSSTTSQRPGQGSSRRRKEPSTSIHDGVDPLLQLVASTGASTERMGKRRRKPLSQRGRKAHAGKSKGGSGSGGNDDDDDDDDDDGRDGSGNRGPGNVFETHRDKKKKSKTSKQDQSVSLLRPSPRRRKRAHAARAAQQQKKATDDMDVDLDLDML